MFYPEASCPEEKKELTLSAPTPPAEVVPSPGSMTESLAAIFFDLHSKVACV